MKKFVLIITLLLGSLAFAKQYVTYNYTFLKPSLVQVSEVARECSKLIANNYRIVSVAFNKVGYLIVYEDDEVEE